MKKLMTTWFVGLLFILLTACNQTAEPVESSTDEDVDVESVDENAEANEDSSDLTVEQLFEKTTAVNEDLQSFSLDMDIEQQMDFSWEKLDMNSQMVMDITTDPFSVKQIMTVDLAEMGVQEMELYYADDSVYLYEPTQDEWMKFPSEVADQIMQLSDENTDLGNQLEQFEAFLEDFTFEEDSNNYILTLHANNEKFDELISNVFENAMPEELGGDELLSNSEFENVTYEIIIDKETFYYDRLDVLMDFKMEIEGEEVNVHQVMKSEYSNHNAIDEITIPQDAVDNAVEMEM